jgi:YVTN family beta-propeller protein
MSILNDKKSLLTILAVAIAAVALVAVVIVTSPAPATSSTTVRHQATVGTYPSGVVFDPTNGLLYVSNEGSDNVSVVNATTFQLVRTIPTGHEARWGSLDPLNGRLFVANDFSSTVSVIDTYNNSLLTTFQTPGYSYAVGVQFDPTSGMVYVLENNNDDLLGVNPDTYAISSVIPILANPGGQQYAINATSDLIYFPARGYSEVQVLDPQNGSTVAQFPTLSPFGPTTTFLDPVNGLLYVMLGGLLDSPGNTTVVLNPATGSIVSSIQVGGWPNDYAYDAGRHLLYVDCEATDDVSVIDTTSNRVVNSISFQIGALPGAIAVNPSNGEIFVTELGTGMLVEVALNGSSPLPSVPQVDDSAVLFLSASRWAI